MNFICRLNVPNSNVASRYFSLTPSLFTALSPIKSVATRSSFNLVANHQTPRPNDESRFKAIIQAEFLSFFVNTTYGTFSYTSASLIDFYREKTSAFARLLRIVIRKNAFRFKLNKRPRVNFMNLNAWYSYFLAKSSNFPLSSFSLIRRVQEICIFYVWSISSGQLRGS